MKNLIRFNVFIILFIIVSAGIVIIMHRTANNQPIPLVIDTDMAEDDWIAILYLLKSPDIDIKAITINGSGEAHGPVAVKNLMKLLKLANAAIPVIGVGQAKPLAGNHQFPEDVRQQVDNMYGLKLPEAHQVHYPQPAKELLMQILAKAKQPVTILSLAPMTNLAELIQGDKEIIPKIKEIVAMGGAVKVSGNLLSATNNDQNNQHAEWNFYIDPVAVQQVFGSGIPIRLVPLDATRYAPNNQALVNRLAQPQNSPISHFVSTVLNNQIKRGDNWDLWDVVAAMPVVHPELLKFNKARLSIHGLTPKSQAAALYMDPEGSLVQYAFCLDQHAFEERLVQGLNKE